MATKTIHLELEIVEGEEAVIKELLAYLAYTKRIKKHVWKDAATLSPAHTKADPSPIKPEMKPIAKVVSVHPMVEGLIEQLAQWKKQDKLVRLKALKGKGKFLDMACKVVSYDVDSGIVTVYDVDRKVVETVRLTEIEDMNLAL